MNQAGALGGLGYMYSSEAEYRVAIKAAEGTPEYWNVLRDRAAFNTGQAPPAPRAAPAPAAPAPAPTVSVAAAPTPAPASGAPASAAPTTSSTQPAPIRTTYPSYVPPPRRAPRQSRLAPLSTLFPGSAQAQAGAARYQAQPAAIGKLPTWVLALIGAGALGGVVAIIRRARS